MRKIKKIKGLRGDVLEYVAQGIPQIDAETAEKGHLWMETTLAAFVEQGIKTCVKFAYVVVLDSKRKGEEEVMEVLNWKEREDKKIEKFPYKGKQYDVKGISVRWLSQCGEDDYGYPEYGLRLFTAQPGGEIPIHNHFYVQTMYILSGRFECMAYEPESGKMVQKQVCGPGDAIYVPSMEPHAMRNLSETEPATFLCCICNVYDKESL